MSFSRRAVILLAGIMAMCLLVGSSCPIRTTTTGNAGNGKTLFDTRCVGCHNGGPAAVLHATSAGLVQNNMANVNAAMTGITLTDQEVADVKAFLETQ